MNMLPLEMVHEVFFKDENSLPYFRGAYKDWMHIIDNECSYKCGKIGLKVPRGRSVETYLKLKAIIPKFFTRLKEMDFQELTCEHLLALRERAKVIEVTDFNSLDKYILGMDKPLILCMTEHLVALSQKLEEFDSYGSHVFRTYLINHYGSLKLSLRAINEESTLYFLNGSDKKDKDCHELAYAAFSSKGNPIAPLILQMYLSKFPLCDLNNLERTNFAYLAHTDTRIRKILFIRERQLNKLKPTEGSEYTELHQAVADQDSKQVERLLAKNEDPNQPDHALVTPLILASRLKSRKIFMQLLKANGDLNQKDMYGFTAMDWAIVCGNSGFKVLFKSSGGSRENRSHANGIPTYFNGIDHGHYEIADLDDVLQLLARILN